MCVIATSLRVGADITLRARAGGRFVVSWSGSSRMLHLDVVRHLPHSAAEVRHPGHPALLGTQPRVQLESAAYPHLGEAGGEIRRRNRG